MDFDGISTYPLASRKSKVHAGMFGRAMDGSETVPGFISKLPRILAGEGRFGMARETGEYMNAAIQAAAASGIGLGEGLGRFIENSGERQLAFEFPTISILAEAYKKKVPVTVHVAIGTDTIHAHPQASGKSLGEATYRDFRLFCSMAKELDSGGVYLNVGSAVVL